MKLLIAEQTRDVEVRFGAGMSEDEFFQFCVQNPELNLERDAHGNILIMAPVKFEGGRFESRAIVALGKWNDETNLGEVFSSQTGFTLPNGAVRSPDASWISNEKLAALSEEEYERFAHICPEVVIEIRSKSDRLKTLQAKMEEYIENGAQLGFLIDPVAQSAAIYRADGPVEIFEGLDGVLSGEPVLPGFSLPLGRFKK